MKEEVMPFCPHALLLLCKNDSWLEEVPCCDYSTEVQCTVGR